jgi:hypothetical protein
MSFGSIPSLVQSVSCSSAACSLVKQFSSLIHPFSMKNSTCSCESPYCSSAIFSVFLFVPFPKSSLSTSQAKVSNSREMRCRSSVPEWKSTGVLYRMQRWRGISIGKTRLTNGCYLAIYPVADRTSGPHVVGADAGCAVQESRRSPAPNSAGVRAPRSRKHWHNDDGGDDVGGFDADSQFNAQRLLDKVLRLHKTIEHAGWY